MGLAGGRGDDGDGPRRRDRPQAARDGASGTIFEDIEMPSITVPIRPYGQPGTLGNVRIQHWFSDPFRANINLRVALMVVSAGEPVIRFAERTLFFFSTGFAARSGNVDEQWLDTYAVHFAKWVSDRVIEVNINRTDHNRPGTGPQFPGDRGMCGVSGQGMRPRPCCTGLITRDGSAGVLMVASVLDVADDGLATVGGAEVGVTISDSYRRRIISVDGKRWRLCARTLRRRCAAGCSWA